MAAPIAGPPAPMMVEKAPRHEERDALPLCVGMVLRAAEFAATEQTATQALNAWLSCVDTQPTIEVHLLRGF